ncbi:MAG: hypothetical protein A6F71_09905 [Cycloclasticus sp. symbiont of Poecilosclerida sp. M]|nr:MAG: hypothetical protein A6F71_09905 [Cycloclasticus sp. symbiont of Poecilosclerida sp. M]
MASSETFKPPPHQHDRWNAPESSDSDDGGKVVRLSSKLRWLSNTNRGNLDEDVIIIYYLLVELDLLGQGRVLAADQKLLPDTETHQLVVHLLSQGNTAFLNHHSKLHLNSNPLNNNSGTDMASLRNLAISLAKDG